MIELLAHASGFEDAAIYESIEMIQIESGWCLGPCPFYIATIEPNDTYRFCGLKFTSTDGLKTGLLPDNSFQSLVQTLSENQFLTLNSLEHGTDNCTVYSTHAASAFISVRFASGQTQRIFWYAGCHIEDENPSELHPRPTRLSDDAIALGNILAHTNQLFSEAGLFADQDSLGDIPREDFWTIHVSPEDCGFEE